MVKQGCYLPYFYRFESLVRFPMRKRVAVSLGKTVNAVSHLGAKQSTLCGDPVWQKICKQNSFYVGVVRPHRTYNIWFIRRRPYSKMFILLLYARKSQEVPNKKLK